MKVMEQATISKEKDKIRVKIIQSGVSANMNEWTEDVLRNSVMLFEGALSYDGHSDSNRKPSELWGKIQNVEYKDNALYGEFLPTPNGAWVKEIDSKKFAEIGLSVHVEAKGRRKNGITYIEEITGGPDHGKPRIDVVLFPSAGGEFQEAKEKKEINIEKKINEEVEQVEKKEKETEKLQKIIEEQKKEIDKLKAQKAIDKLFAECKLFPDILLMVKEKTKDVYDVETIKKEIDYAAGMQEKIKVIKKEATVTEPLKDVLDKPVFADEVAKLFEEVK